MTMLAVKNFFLPERKGPPDTPKFSRMPEVFLRSIKRRSLRVKRTKSLVVVDREKRKSDSFINSQEWTLSRSVPDLRLGIIGAVNSGKSALVHRYLTGSYTQEESPEGGRYKKEIYLDNQSYLLLIRDEGGQPEMQFAAWVDAVIFVFSLEDEYSFNAVYNYYTRMSHFRNNSEIPMILVGTQDAISEQNPRVIDEVRARKLANDMKRCPYYETCATYGLNVERVFQDACSKIVQHRVSTTSIPQVTPNNSRPSTPQGHRLSAQNYQQAIVNGYPANSSPSLNHHNMPNSHAMTLPRQHVISAPPTNLPLRISSEMINNEQLHGNYNFLQPANVTQKWSNTQNGPNGSAMIIPTENNNIAKYTPPLGNVHPPQPIEIPTPWSTSTMTKDRKDKELPTPTSTPTTSRKSRRRSNLFIPSSKKNEDKLKVNGELGSGRTIPIKQGYLYKRSSKPLNKDWKKKYVTLCSDGRLTYHSSLNDYMEDSHGKEIPLHCVTVKVPGQKPRGSQSVVQNGSNGIQNGGSQNGIISNGVCEGISGLSIGKEKRNSEKVLLTAYDSLREPNKSNNHSQTSGDEGIAMSSSNSQTFLLSDSNTNAKVEVQTPNVKKRHRRIKSSSVKNCENDEAESLDFFIISLYNKQWHFEAQTSEERDDWVNAIQQQIFKSLQGNESSKPKSQSSTATASMESIKNCVPGNGFCADCDTPDPDWASLNLGILLCIDCSGIHRKLGTHISKVRSLGLDDWPHSHLSVMLAIGNSMANSIWEANKRGYAKPTPSSIREDREDWIRRKYELKEFLLPCNHSIPIGKQIVEAVVTIDIRQLIVLMANASSDDVNSTVGPCDLRTSLHLACAIGHLVMAQILIWNNAHVNKGDQEGNTCLSYARAALANAQKLSDPHEVENVNALVDLLVALECPETVTMAYGTGTLSRRRESLEPNFEKVPSTII